VDNGGSGGGGFVGNGGSGGGRFVGNGGSGGGIMPASLELTFIVNISLSSINPELVDVL
jgi:hypothetical protein